MRDLIIEKLNEIEKRENVKILHCVESGSRAWGFASPDSDYDVRFIYAREREFYLRLDKTRDVIEWQLDDTLDINGWDIKKALTLLHSSNPTLFEWNSSPIVYRTTDEWQSFASELDRYFSVKKGLYHYLSTAKRTYRENFKGDEVRAKKYFYVLRPLLACRWILSKGTPPPMEFRILAENYLDGEVKSDVMRLLELKINSPEIAVSKRLCSVIDYIDSSIAEMEERLSLLPDEEAMPWEKLNGIFLKITE